LLEVQSNGFATEKRPSERHNGSGSVACYVASGASAADDDFMYVDGRECMIVLIDRPQVHFALAPDGRKAWAFRLNWSKIAEAITILSHQQILAEL
jgi:hypothetical protein